MKLWLLENYINLHLKMNAENRCNILGCMRHEKAQVFQASGPIHGLSGKGENDQEIIFLTDAGASPSGRFGLGKGMSEELKLRPGERVLLHKAGGEMVLIERI